MLFGGGAGICLASSHIIRRSSLRILHREWGFSGSDAQPPGKIMGCKAMVLRVKPDELATPATGQLMKRMGLEEVETTDHRSLSMPTPTSVCRPSWCKLTCRGWVHRRVTLCAWLQAVVLLSLVLMCNVSFTEPATGTEWMRCHLCPKDWGPMKAPEHHGLEEVSLWGMGWGRRARGLVRTQERKEVSSPLRPPGESAKTSHKWLS